MAKIPTGKKGIFRAVVIAAETAAEKTSNIALTHIQTKMSPTAVANSYNKKIPYTYICMQAYQESSLHKAN